MSEQPPFRKRPDLPELLQSERERPEPPREAKLRVMEAMRRSIADAEGEDPSQSLRLVPKAAGSLMGWLFAYAPLALAGLGATGFFALGAYLAVHPDALQPLAGPWRKPPEVRAPVVVPPPPSVPAPAPQAAPAKRPALGTGGARVLPVAPQPDPGDTSHAQSLESRLLEQARTAIKGGRNEAALKSLAEAEQVEEVLDQGTYAGAGNADGALAEQREALMILALSRSGNLGEAKRQMTRFTAHHPQSFYLNQLQDELKSNEGAAR